MFFRGARRSIAFCIFFQRVHTAQTGQRVDTAVAQHEVFFKAANAPGEFLKQDREF